MSERGSFVTEYVYCDRCFAVIKEIRKAGTVEAKNDLACHRMCKPEVRLAHLALAFVQGQPYKTCEAATKDPVIVHALAQKISRFLDVSRTEVMEWLET